MPTPSELPLLRAASWGACGTEPIRDGVEQREPLPIRTSTRSIAPPEAVHLAPADPQVVRVSFAGSILVEFGEMSVTEADELRAKFGWHRPGITEHGPATPADFPTEEAGSGRRPSPRYVGWRVASLRKVFVKANRSPSGGPRTRRAERGRPRRLCLRPSLQAGSHHAATMSSRLPRAQSDRTAFSSTDRPSFRSSSEITRGGRIRTQLP